MIKIILFFLLPVALISQNTISYQNLTPGTYNSYISKDLIPITVGDVIEIGLPGNGDLFRFITQGNTPAASHITGATVTISKLKVIGTAATGYRMFAYFKGFGLLPVIINIDAALKTEEIIIL